MDISPIFPFCLEMEPFNHFSLGLKFYPEFSVVRTCFPVHDGQTTLHTPCIWIFIQWLRLLPSLIFPMSLAASLIAFDRSQTHRNTLALFRKAEEAAADPNFWWLGWYPLPYKAFNWKQHRASNLFKMYPSPGIHWIEPKTQDPSSLEKHNIRGDRASAGKTYRNAEVCKMAQTHSMRFGKSQNCCSQTRSAWSLNWFDIVAGDGFASEFINPWFTY